MAAPRTIPKSQTAVLVGPKERRLETIPVATPGPDEVLIENVAVASNPKDWKVPKWIYKEDEAYVEGNDVAGTIVAVGENVSEYKVGARVAAFTIMRTKDNKVSSTPSIPRIGELTSVNIVRRLPAIHRRPCACHVPHPQYHVVRGGRNASSRSYDRRHWPLRPSGDSCARYSGGR